jgi:DNA-binding transcriptional ArsR family regulator
MSDAGADPTDPTDPSAPLINATDPVTARALSHPTRHRLLLALGDQGATVSQLANRLMINKGNVAHHLGELVAAGLVRKGATRTVRGGTEQYYLRETPRIEVGPGDPAVAMLGNLVAEITSDDRAVVNHRVLRLTARQAQSLAKHLDDFVDRLEPAAEREQQYGVVVAVYRHRDVRRAGSAP